MDVQKETSEIRELKAEELDEVAGGPGGIVQQDRPPGVLQVYWDWYPGPIYKN
jgi:hypothetical protein